MARWLAAVKQWWFARTTPDAVPLATTATRERQRKARLLSICACCMFAFVSPVMVESAIAFPIGIVTAGIFELALIGALILNRHDKLEIATAILLGGYMIDVGFGQWIYSPNVSAAFLWEWTGLIVPALLAGLFLSVRSIFLVGFANCVLNTLIYVTWQRYGAFVAHLPASDHADLLIYIYLITIGTTTIGAIYAHSLAKAVTLADRAAELGQAYDQIATANQRLEKLAQHDPTTGLLNHRALNERLAQEHAHAISQGAPLGIIFADIDHFKHINDTWGHQVGDVALLHVATCLCTVIREVDIVARYGGEEFVVVLPGHDHATALHIAERLRHVVATQRLALTDGRSVPITMSFGVAVFPDDGRDVAELLVAADAAMYHAKHHGRNRVCTVNDTRSSQRDAA